MTERATGLTAESILTAIRREAGDPALDRSGNTIPAAQLEFTDADCLAALNNAMRWVQTEMSLPHPGDAMLSVDATYDASESSMVLPSPIIAPDRIVKVENVNNASLPIPIHEVSPLEIERYQTPFPASWIPPTTAYRYTLVSGGDDGTEQHIAIRPRPGSGLRLRIWYVAPPLIFEAEDSVDLAAVWIELITMRAARSLLSRNDEFSDQQEMRYGELADQFKKASNRQKAPQRVRRRRIGIS